MLTVTAAARASGPMTYGGYQPWWNVLAKKNRHMTEEEKRLQRFWHDYYDAMHRYYQALDHVDWVAYYKNHGYQINTGCTYGAYGSYGGPQRIQFAPVFVSPQMQWAVPNSAVNGPPVGPACGPTGCAPMGGMYGYGQ
jgi:hypothetical protein